MPRHGNYIVLGSTEIDPANLVLSDGVASSKIQVAKCGVGFKKGQRQFDITESMMDQMVSNCEKVKTQIPIDYNHLSLGAVVPDQAIAAGWFKSLERVNRELWGLAEFTPKAAEHIKNKEFRYISPTIDPLSLDEKGEPAGSRLISAALTIYPFLKGMAPVSLSELQIANIVLADMSLDELRARLSTALSDRYKNHPDFAWFVDAYPDDKYLVFRLGEKLFRLDYEVDDKWNIDFTNDPQEVVSAGYTVLSERHPEDKPMPDPKDNKQITGQEELQKQYETLSASVQKLSEDLTAAKTRNTELETKLKRRDAESAVDPLIRQAKVKKEDRDAWVELHMDSPERFNKLTANLTPAVVLGKAHGHDGNAAEEEDDENKDKDVDPIKLMEDRVDKYIADNGGPSKVRMSDALREVSSQDPKLAEEYRSAFQL